MWAGRNWGQDRLPCGEAMLLLLQSSSQKVKCIKTFILAGLKDWVFLTFKKLIRLKHTQALPCRHSDRAHTGKPQSICSGVVVYVRERAGGGEGERLSGLCFAVFLSSPPTSPPHFLFRGGLPPSPSVTSSTHCFLERFHGQGTDNHHLSENETA